MSYDSTKDTLNHIEHVKDMLDEVILILRKRPVARFSVRVE